MIHGSESSCCVKRLLWFTSSRGAVVSITNKHGRRGRRGVDASGSSWLGGGLFLSRMRHQLLTRLLFLERRFKSVQSPRITMIHRNGMLTNQSVGLETFHWHPLSHTSRLRRTSVLKIPWHTSINEKGTSYLKMIMWRRWSLSRMSDSVKKHFPICPAWLLHLCEVCHIPYRCDLRRTLGK